MATATMDLASLNGGLCVVTLTYDDVTLAIASVTGVNNDMVAHTFTATVGTKTWTATLAAGKTQTVSVPHNVASSLVFTSDTTQTPPLLYVTGYTLSVV